MINFRLVSFQEFEKGEEEGSKTEEGLGEGKETTPEISEAMMAQMMESMKKSMGSGNEDQEFSREGEESDEL